MCAPDVRRNRRRQLSVSLIPSIVALIVLCIAGLAGCGGKGIVGTWTGQVATPGEKPAVVTLIYKPDGTMSQATNIMGHTVSGSYTYAIQNDRITETLTGGAFDGKPIKVARSRKPAIVYTYKLDGDSLSLKSDVPGGNLSLRRAE